MMNYMRNWREQPFNMLGAVTVAFVAVGGLISRDIGDRLFVGLALVLFACGLAALSPGAAIGALVLAVPTAFELHPLPGGTYSLLEIAILAAAFGTGMRVVVDGPRSWKRAIGALFEAFQVTLPALLLVPVAIATLFMMPDIGHRTEALREIRLVIVEPLLAFACMLIVFRVGRLRRWAWMCAASIGTVVATVALGEFALGRGVDAGSVTRATALYTHPNNLALFLERTLLLTLPLVLLRGRSGWTWIIVGIQVGGLLVTFSRGGYVAVVIGAIIALMLLGMRKQLVWLLGITCVSGAGLMIVARDRVLDIGGDGAEPTRFAIWRSSVRMLADHPYWGVGPDQFLYQYGRRYIEPGAWPERYTSHPHNLILDAWLRLGMVGLALFGAMAIFVLQWVAIMRQQIAGDIIAVGSAAALCGGLAHGMLDNGFFIPDLAVMTWVAIAFLLTLQSGTSD